MNAEKKMLVINLVSGKKMTDLQRLLFSHFFFFNVIFSSQHQLFRSVFIIFMVFLSNTQLFFVTRFNHPSVFNERLLTRFKKCKRHVF